VAGVGEYIEGNSSPNDQYVDVGTGELQQRTDNPAAIDATEITLGGTVTISAIPIGSTAYFNDADNISVDDGVLTITPSSVGDYDFELLSARHFGKSFTFKVVEN
jgi:hypothetical protein